MGTLHGQGGVHRNVRLSLGLLAMVFVASGCSLTDSFVGDLAADDLDASSSDSSSLEGDGGDYQSEIKGPTVAADWGQPAQVIRVIDGDSLKLEVDGREVEARLGGFNAPELFGQQNNKTCQGEKAKQALEQLAEAGNVRFQAESQDRFGRTLGRLAVEGQLVIDQLLIDGWGLATSDDRVQRNYTKDAAEAKRGIWGDGCGQPESSEVVIGESHVDADGNDRWNLNDEWVEITNSGNQQVSLAGWTIRDETYGHRFPLDGELDSGQSLRVRSGTGTNSSTEMFLAEQYPVWSNSDETVVVVDPAGVFVHWVFLD